MELIDSSLSEPYSVFTYRYFLQQWPNLCVLACDGGRAVGVIVCKMDDHRGHLRGYIAMLVVDNACRGRGLGAFGVLLLQRGCSARGSSVLQLKESRAQCALLFAVGRLWS